MQIKLTQQHPLYPSLKDHEWFIRAQSSNGTVILETWDGEQVYATFEQYEITGPEAA